MANDFRIRVSGGEQLGRALDRLGQAVGGIILGQALRAAAEPIRDRARELAPRRTGFLAEHIVVVPDPERENALLVGTTKKAFYGHMQEFGVQPHAIGKGSTLRSKGRRQTGRMHPGHAAHPFMRPAIDQCEDEAGRRFAEVLRRGIEEHSR